MNDTIDQIEDNLFNAVNEGNIERTEFFMEKISAFEDLEEVKGKILIAGARAGQLEVVKWIIEVYGVNLEEYGVDTIENIEEGRISNGESNVYDEIEKYLEKCGVFTNNTEMEVIEDI